MSDRPTWETDIHSDFNACMHKEYCRELKRQRDAAVEALKVLLNSDPTGAIANATDDALSAALDDPDADSIVKQQAAAILQARAVLREIEGES